MAEPTPAEDRSTTAGRPRSPWRRIYALPAEHGTWIWLLGPWVLGAVAARRPSPGLIPLGLAALAAFLLRQPLTIAIKALSGRRAREDLRPALMWAVGYLLLAALGLVWLLALGHGRLLVLALPGIPVFAWHLWLVSRRQERGQPGIEIVAAGALALAGPAAYWTAGGASSREGWILWLLTWLQAASSIVHVHLRLQQRQWEQAPPRRVRLRLGARALAYAGFNLMASLMLSGVGWAPSLAPLAFAVALLDTADGVARPAVGRPARAIGLRQLASSALFLVLLGIAYLR